MPIAVSAQVEPDVTHIFSDISIPRGHVVDSATCFFCSIHIEGQLKRDATANWGDVDIEGDVGGDCVAVGGQIHLGSGAQVIGATVSVFGDTQLDSNARIGDDAVAAIGAVRLSPGSVVTKSTISQPLPLLSRLPARIRTFVFLWSTGMLISIPLAFLSLLLFKRERLKIMSRGINDRRWTTILLGIISLGVLTTALSLFGDTKYEDYVEPPLTCLLILFAAPGYTALAHRLGSRFQRGINAALLVGTILLVTVQTIPVVGWLLFPVLMIISYGSLALCLRRTKAVPVPAEAHI
jgi:hypothetical protein